MKKIPTLFRRDPGRRAAVNLGHDGWEGIERAQRRLRQLDLLGVGVRAALGALEHALDHDPNGTVIVADYPRPLPAWPDRPAVYPQPLPGTPDPTDFAGEPGCVV